MAAPGRKALSVHSCSIATQTPTTPGGQDQQTVYTRPLKEKLDALKIAHEIVWEPGPGEDTRERVEAVKRWFVHDWQTGQQDQVLDCRGGFGVSCHVRHARCGQVFCPDAPEIPDDPQAIPVQAQAREKAVLAATRKEQETQEPDKGPGVGVEKAEAGLESDKKPDGDDKEKKPIPGKAGANRIEGPQHLPPLHELIEGGKVLALNMPAGSNPAPARAVGVMLKNAWLQALLMRPARMKESPGVYFRPAVFICDEYQAFASVGEDDPSGDEKSFALTRQCRCIPIVATQSISSLRSVLGSSEAWRALLQTLRTRIFLSLTERRR